MAIAPPDLSARPFRLTVERVMNAPPDALFRAWTQQFDRWFAVPGSVLMKGEVNAPFYFETRFEGTRHPHYGRFLALEPDRLVELAWLTDATHGVETVVTVELTPQDGPRSGSPTQASRMRRRETATPEHGQGFSSTSTNGWRCSLWSAAACCRFVLAARRSLLR
jgi:uncharacterized protein YndB with AHSA1/START domain